MVAQDKFKKGDWVETIKAVYYSDIPYGTRGVVVGFTCVSSGERSDGDGGDLVIVDFGPEYAEFNETFGKRVGKTYTHKFLKNLSREEEPEEERSTYPKRIYVRVEDEGTEDSYLIADKDIDEAQPGKVAVYELVEVGEKVETSVFRTKVRCS